MGKIFDRLMMSDDIELLATKALYPCLLVNYNLGLRK